MEMHSVVLGPTCSVEIHASSLAGPVCVGLRDAPWSPMDLGPHSCTNICWPCDFGHIMYPLLVS